MPSIFASRFQKTIPVPFDDGHEVTIQKLTGRHLELARQAQQVASFDFVRQIGGAAACDRELAAVGSREKVADEVAAVRADPRRRYDRTTILLKGVKAWTYDVPVSVETIEDLSDEAASWLADEILQLTFPTGDAQKKTS
jgi:hypothetical protein